MMDIKPYSLLVGFMLLWKLSQASECQHKIISVSRNEGYISSPNYPHTYPPGVCVKWFLSPNATWFRVSINILDISIPSSVEDGCSGDRLSFGPLQPRTCCSNLNPSRYEADQRNVFYIMFNSTQSGVKGRGFVMRYSFKTADITPKIVIGSGVTTKRPNAITTAVMTAQKGFKGSNSGPSLSPCSYMISEERGRITMDRSWQWRHIFQNRGLQCSWSLVPTTRLQNGYIYYRLRFSYLHLIPGVFLDVYGGLDSSQNHQRLAGNLRVPTVLQVLGGSVVLKLTGPEVTSRSPRLWGNFSVEYQRHAVCMAGYSPCGGNESRCYHYNKHCDGVLDCPVSGGDESGCYYKCPANKYSCHDKSDRCYDLADRCNGKVTCINHMDEMECSPEQCSSSKGLFLCKDRRCIFEIRSCDGYKDCDDGSDEENCSTMLSPRIIMAAVVGSLLCSLLLVIALSFACKVYALHNHRHRGECGHESPLSRLEAEILRHRAPPPPYSEAMLTSRPYEEAYLELLNNAAAAASEQQTGPSTNETLTNEQQQNPSQHSMPHTSTPCASGQNRRPRRHHHRHRRQRNSQQTGPASHNVGGGGGILSNANHQYQLLLHRAGLAPPPYSLLDTPQDEVSSSDSEDGGEDTSRDEPQARRGESPGVEESSLSSCEVLDQVAEHYPVDLPDTSLSSLSEIGLQDMRSTLAGDLEGSDLTRMSNCDKEETDDTSSEASNVDVMVDAGADVVEPRLSLSSATDREEGTSTVEGTLDGDEEDDDCPCILTEETEALNDEIRINGDDCLLNG